MTFSAFNFKNKQKMLLLAENKKIEAIKTDHNLLLQRQTAATNAARPCWALNVYLHSIRLKWTPMSGACCQKPNKNIYVFNLEMKQVFIKQLYLCVY